MSLQRSDHKTRRVPLADALPGRVEAVPVPDRHTVLGTTLLGPFADGLELAQFGMGCFWGAERLFWPRGGVYSTAVGYAGGFTPNPTYEEVCSGLTGHAEVVRVVFDPGTISYETLLNVFWQGHDPTQYMRQGNDSGTQYRSAIHCYTAGQRSAALSSELAYGAALKAEGFAEVTTEIADAPVFYFAEACHQQYLAKHPGGYCGLGGTGVSC